MTNAKQVLGRFQDQWSLGSRPSLPAALEELAQVPDSTDEAYWLAKIDLRFRVLAGDAEPLSELLEVLQSRQIRLTREQTLDLARLEYDGRWGRGELGARKSEYAARFPDLADEIRGWYPEWDCPSCGNDSNQLPSEEVTEVACQECKKVYKTVGVFKPADQSFDLRKYELIDDLGSGGMGEVYSSRDPGLGRDLALKVLRKQLAGHREAERRFEREARLTGCLEHPGIVPIHNLGRLFDRRPFFTMKLVRGQTFEQKLNSSGHTPRERVASCFETFEKICQAIAYAHQKGVIHRDLKPSNVMVGEFGEVQTMDWGLAKQIDEPNSNEAEREVWTAKDAFLQNLQSDDAAVVASLHTGNGQLMGTLLYMPPEQAANAASAKKPADVFALGAMLCELLTGAPPCLELAEYSRLQELQAARLRLEAEQRRVATGSHDKGQPLADYDRDLKTVDAQLGELAHKLQLAERVKACNTAPGLSRLSALVQTMEGDRSQFVIEPDEHRDPIIEYLVPLTRDCLRSSSAERPQDAGEVGLRLKSYVTAVREAADKRLIADEQRRRTQMVAALTTVLAVVGIGAALWIGRANVDLAAQTRIAEKQTTVANSRSRQLGTSLSRTLVQRGIADAAAKSGRALAHLTAARNVSAQFTSELDESHRRRMGAMLSANSFVTLENVFESPEFEAVVLDPKGDRVALRRYSSVSVVDSRTGTEAARLLHRRQIHDLAFSADGSMLATAADDGMVRLWDAATGKALGNPLRHDGPARQVRFIPSSTWLITTSGPNNSQAYKLHTWDTRTGAALTDPIQLAEAPLALEASPEGMTESDDFARIRGATFTTSNATHVVHWTMAEGPFEINAKRWEFKKADRLEYSPNGRLLLAIGAEDLGPPPQVRRVSTGEEVGGTLRNNLGRVKTARLIGNGNFVATAEDDTVLIWNIDNTVEQRADFRPQKVLRHDAPVQSIDVSPDGRLLAAATIQGKLSVWEISTGELYAPPTTVGSDLISARFLPEGHRLFTARKVTTSAAADGKSAAGEAKVQELNAVTLETTGEVDAGKMTRMYVDSSPSSLIFNVAAVEKDDSEKRTRVTLVTPSHEAAGPSQELSGSVAVLAGSKSGRHLAALTWDPLQPLQSVSLTAHVWENSPNEQVRSWRLESSYNFRPPALAFSHDGQFVAIGHAKRTSGDGYWATAGSVGIWNAVDGAVVIPPHDCLRPVVAIAFANDDSRVHAIAGSESALGGAIHTWTKSGGTWRHSEQSVATGTQITAADVSPGAEIAVIGCADGTVELWDLAKGSLVSTEFKHSEWVSAVACSLSGNVVFSAGDDQRVFRYSFADKQLTKANLPISGRVIYLSSLDDQTCVMRVQEQQRPGISLSAWNAATNRFTSRQFEDDGWVKHVSGRLFVHTSTGAGPRSTDRGELSLWNFVATENLARSFAAMDSRHPQFFSAAAFSRDGRRIIAATREGDLEFIGGFGRGFLQAWDARTGNMATGEQALDAEPIALAVNNRGNIVAIVGGSTPTMVEWDFEDSAILRTVPLGFQWRPFLDALSLSPDGRFVAATAIDNGVDALFLCDLQADPAVLPQVVSEPLHLDQLDKLAWSKDSSRLAWQSLRGVTIYQAPDLARVRSEIPFESGTGSITHDLAVSANGVVVSAVGNEGKRTGQARIWDTGRNQLRVSLDHDGIINEVSFDSAERLLATASDDTTAAVWDAEAGTKLWSFEHNGKVEKAQISPDGTMLVTAQEGGTVRVWSLKDGEQIIAPISMGKYIAHLAFNPDSTQVLAVAPRRPIRLIDLRPANLSRDDSTALALILSGQKVADDGAMAPATPQMVRDGWVAARRSKQLSQFFKPNLGADVAWGYQEVAAAEATEDWAAAVWHLKRLIAAKADADWSDYVRLGVVQLERFDDKSAAAAFTRAIELGGDRWWIRQLRAEAMLADKEADAEAVGRDIAEAAKGAGNLWTFWFDVGQAYMERKLSSQARDALAKAAELKPDHALIHMKLGDAALSGKDYATAIKAYTRVLELKPNDANALYWRGVAYGSSAPQDWQKALEDWDRVQALDYKGFDDRHRCDFHFNRGLAHENLSEKPELSAAEKQSRLSKAEAEYQEAVTWDKKRGELFLRLGTVQLNQDFRGGYAVSSFDEARALFKGTPEEDAELSLLTASALLKSAMFDVAPAERAIMELLRCQELKCDNRDVRSLLGDAYRYLRNFEAAAREYTGAIRFQQTDGWSLYWLAASLVELGRLDDGLLALTAVTALPDTNAVEKHHLAVLLRRLKKNDEYEEVRNSMISQYSPETMLPTVRAAVLTSELPEPLRIKEAQLRAVSEDPSATYAMIQLYAAFLFRTGQFKDSIAQFERGMSKWTDPPPGLPFNQAFKDQQAKTWLLLSPTGVGGQPYDWAFLAMAHHKLGDHENAKKWLELARKCLKRPPLTLPKASYPVEEKTRRTAAVSMAVMLESDTWYRRVEGEILLEEATRLISPVDN